MKKAFLCALAFAAAASFLCSCGNQKNNKSLSVDSRKFSQAKLSFPEKVKLIHFERVDFENEWWSQGKHSTYYLIVRFPKEELHNVLGALGLGSQNWHPHDNPPEWVLEKDANAHLPGIKYSAAMENGVFLIVSEPDKSSERVIYISGDLDPFLNGRTHP